MNNFIIRRAAQVGRSVREFKQLVSSRAREAINEKQLLSETLTGKTKIQVTPNAGKNAWIAARVYALLLLCLSFLIGTYLQSEQYVAACVVLLFICVPICVCIYWNIHLHLLSKRSDDHE